MRLLLDTHAFLWAVASPRRLSRTATSLIVEPSNEVLVSAASAWELATKHRIGKLDVAAAVIHGFSFAVERLRSTELPISAEHALAAGGFDHPHRDPFDRLLAAQALIEGATLLTSDRALEAFPVTTAW